MAVTKKRGRKPLNPTGPMSGAERMRKFREQRRGDGFQTLERAWSRATAEGRAKFRDAVLAADGVKGAWVRPVLSDGVPPAVGSLAMSAGPPAATAAELRAMAQRELAHDVPDDVMSARLLEIATELETQANAQERQNPPWPTIEGIRRLREVMLAQRLLG